VAETLAVDGVVVQAAAYETKSKKIQIRLGGESNKSQFKEGKPV